MKQGLGLGAALLLPRRLVVLDEPTNGLDPDGILEMRRLIGELAEGEGVTVFVSSHILAEVEQTATHIALMDAGRLVAQGPVGTLKAAQRRRVTFRVRQPERLVRLLGECGIEAAIEAPATVRVADRCAEAAAADISAINFLMVERGIEVLGISVAEPSLEDYFVQALRGEAEAPLVPALALAA
jgi:ABC-2 type transport system ATP-binding protein